MSKDADLIMLGLASHEPHFRVLREDVFYQESKARTCRICGQKGHIAEACKGLAKPKDGEFGEKDATVPLKPFIWLHVSALREYLEAELHVPQQPFRFDLERAIDDWVFMCFFVGNDFLPHLPSLDIREDGIDTLIAIWRDNIPLMKGYVTKDGHMHPERVQLILDGLAKQEDAIFQRRRQTEERRDANAKRRKLEQGNRNSSGRCSDGGPPSGSGGRRKSPDYSTPTHMRGNKTIDTTGPPEGLQLFEPGKGISAEQKALTHDMVVNRGAVYKANLENKSAAAALKSQLLKGTLGNEAPDTPKGVPETKSIGTPAGLTNSEQLPQTPASALGKRKAGMMDGDENSTPGRGTPDSTAKGKQESDEPPPDHVRLWEEGYADRYYEQKFKADPSDIAFRNKVAKAYVEGLQWVL